MISGVFIARGKEDTIVTKNMVVGESVYGEKRISTEVCSINTHTRILKPFEDSEPMGLKVDIALQMRPTEDSEPMGLKVDIALQMRPTEDSEPMGLKVDIALQARPTDIGRLSWVTLIEVQRYGVPLQWHNQLRQSLEEGCVVWCDHEATRVAAT